MTVVREPITEPTAERLTRAMSRAALERVAGDPGSTLLHFENPDLIVLTRLEQSDIGPELCVVAVEGRGAVDHWPQFMALCRANGITRLRAHVESERPQLGRLWHRLGFEPVETVYAREV